MVAELLSAAGVGLALGVRFNPLAAPLGAVIAAAIGSREGRTGLAALAVGVAWLLGDGLRVLAKVLDASDGTALLASGGGPQTVWLALSVWALGGLLLGYALPAWAGVFVGRRVTFGAGWLAAGAVAATASVGIALLAGQLG